MDIVSTGLLSYILRIVIQSRQRKEREKERGGDPPAEVYGWFIQSDKQLDLYSGIGFGVGLKIVQEARGENGGSVEEARK